MKFGLFERIVLGWVAFLLTSVIWHIHPLDKWLKTSDAAPWAQTIAVAVGVLIAILVPAWQHNEARSREELAARETARHLAAIARDLAGAAENDVIWYCKRVRAWDRLTPFAVGTSELEQTSRQIERLSTRLLTEASLTEVSTSVRNLLNPIAHCLDTSKRWTKPELRPTDSELRILQGRIEVVRKNRERLNAAVDRYLRGSVGL